MGYGVTRALHAYDFEVDSDLGRVRSIKVGVADVRRKSLAPRGGFYQYVLTRVHPFSLSLSLFFSLFLCLCFFTPACMDPRALRPFFFLRVYLPDYAFRVVSCRVVSRVKFSLFSWFHDPSWCFSSDMLTGFFFRKG